MAYATFSDVQSHMIRTMTTDEQALCTALLDDAAIIIDAYNADAAADNKKLVSVNMVKRAIGDDEQAGIPLGATQGSMSGLGYSQSWTQGAGASTGEVYLGKAPETFTYEGKTYTPMTFAASTGLNPDDYVSLTSFTHHPYSTGANKGKGFIIEVQDNWRWGESLNLELDDFMQIIDDAIKAGYTVLWGGDVSEDGFTRDGLAVYPDMEAPDAPGADQARWLRLDRSAKGKELSEKPLPQKKVTVEERQRGYDNFETGDDHGMHLFGTAKDQEGNLYYLIKNSWGVTGKYDGIWYMTPEFARAKTLNYVVNKNAISKALRAKYGI